MLKFLLGILYYIRRHKGLHTGGEPYQYTKCQMPFVLDSASKVTSEHTLERSLTSVTSVKCPLSAWWFERPLEKTHCGLKTLLSFLRLISKGEKVFHLTDNKLSHLYG